MFTLLKCFIMQFSIFPSEIQPKIHQMCHDVTWCLGAFSFGVDSASKDFFLYAKMILKYNNQVKKITKSWKANAMWNAPVVNSI